MKTERKPLHWSIASPSEIERTARDLMRFRNRFLTAENWDGQSVRPLILRSWERCRAMHVDANRRSAPLAVTRDAQLVEIREASEPLLRAAREVIDRLSDQLVDSGYVIVLTNATGCILKIVGDRSIQARLARIDFVPGGDWSESAAGTNAIGTALSDRRSVQLLAAEHFCDGWTDLTCTAVPIRDPLSGEVIGVLDITGNYRLIRVHLTNLLAVSVLEIEDRLRRLHESDRRPARPFSLVQAPKSTPEFADDNVLLTFASGAVGASLDLLATIRTIAEQTEAVLKAQSTAVFLFATEGEEAPYQHVWSQAGGLPDDGLAAAIARCEAPMVLRERGEPIIADDIASAPIFGESGAFAPFRSIALLPLPTARGTIGFVAAARRSVAPWSFADLRRAFALMAGAATAIDNALLFESVRQQNRHVEAINAIAQLLGELLEPAERLDDILHAIVETLAYDAGVLYLRSSVDGTLEEVARHGEICSVRSAGCGNSHSTAALCAGTTDLGVLELCGGANSQPHPGDQATIGAIAQQLAMALKNAQLLRTAGEVEVLRRADRLKSEFLATVSHDLRSPLTAICAGIDGMLDSPEGVAIDDGFLHTIWNQANRLGRLVDQLLDISQIEHGGLRLDREWHDLQSLLEDVRDGIEPLYGPKRIVLQVSSTPPLLFVDRDRFIQVLYNLVDNACKYSPTNTSVTIGASWSPDEITIAVTDSGPGIGEREREHIFKRFYRGDGAMGTMRSIGLGLAICRGIVEAHGGTIWLEEPSGLGSVFRFRIPLRTDFGREFQSTA
ncbi:MAG: ATP-binding protein [Candidatus Velthaea sp.]